MTSDGVIYVAFTRTSTGGSTSYMTQFRVGFGWTFVGQFGPTTQAIGPGPTPVIDATNNGRYLFVRDENFGQPFLRTFYSSDGSSWSEFSEQPSAPGFFYQTVKVNGTDVKAVPFMSIKYDTINHNFLVVYHRQNGNFAPQVVTRRFTRSATPHWTDPVLLADNMHSQWHPVVVQLGNGDFVIAYYDYTLNASGYTIYAARMNAWGTVVDNSRIFTTYDSNPAGYNLQGSTVANIGEYQGLTVFNDTLYASTLQIQNGVGNAIALRFIP